MLKIVILGDPVTQLRPIFNSKTKRAIDPKKCRDYKKKVRETAKNYLDDTHELIDEPIKVVINSYIGVTKSWTKKKKSEALNGTFMPTYKRDTDNLAKPVMDGCSGVVWKDDGCIVDLHVSKRYDKFPRNEVRIYKLNDNLEWE